MRNIKGGDKIMEGVTVLFTIGKIKRENRRRGTADRVNWESREAESMRNEERKIRVGACTALVLFFRVLRQLC